MMLRGPWGLGISADRAHDRPTYVRQRGGGQPAPVQQELSSGFEATRRRP
jgi:hypothetical protein